MKNVGKIYRTETVETHALCNFDLHVDKGEFVAITGPSGSGKTSFLNVAGLLETYESGDYYLDNINTNAMDDNQRSHIRNEKIGFIFQNFNLIPDLNAFDNIDVPLRYRRLPRADRNQRIRHALDRVGLTARAQHYPSQLSGGQQQRVAIARAIAGSPTIILADEPTGNLDSSMSQQIIDLLEKINADGTTIVMVTHSLELARRAQRNVQIIDGKAHFSRNNEN